MATWTFGVKTVADTALTSNYFAISTGYALNFGSGDRDALMQAISVGSYASCMHVVDGVTSSESDVCTGNHAWYCRFGDTSTSYYGYASASTVDLVGPMTMALGSPATYEGVNFHFAHTVAVAVSPIQIWFASGDACVSQHNACHVVAVELNSAAPMTTGWVHIRPDNKLSLTAHNSTSTGHSWWCSISLMPTSISFNAEGRVKAEATYY